VATIDMSRKEGVCCATFAGAGNPSSTMQPGPRLFPYQATSSSIQPFDQNRHRPKIGWGWVCPFSGSSWVHIEVSKTTSRRTRPTSVPSGILIHEAVWPLYRTTTKMMYPTDRQTDRQTDKGLIAYSDPC